MTELRTAYGAPSTNRKSKAANEILTYGIFRFIGDSNGKIAGIIFPVGWECPSKADISEPHLLFGIWEYSTMVGLVKGTTYYTSGNIQGHLNLDANGQCQSEYSIGSDTTLEQEHGRYEIKGNQVLLKRNNGRPDSSLLAYGNTTGNKNITLLREQRGGGPEFIRYILRKK